MQVDPMFNPGSPYLISGPEKYDELLSNFAFKFNMRPSIEAHHGAPSPSITKRLRAELKDGEVGPGHNDWHH